MTRPEAVGAQSVNLLEHPAFDWKNPNKIRSVVGAFAGQNLAAFHNPDGSGYQFLAGQVCRLDDSNPQIAARLVTPLTRWRKFAPAYGEPDEIGPGERFATNPDCHGMSMSGRCTRALRAKGGRGIRLPHWGTSHRRIQNRTFGR